MCFMTAHTIYLGWRGFSHFVRICPETLHGGTEPISSLASRLAVSKRLASPASAFPPGSPHVLSLCLLFRRSSNTSVPELQRQEKHAWLLSPMKASGGHSIGGCLHPHPQYHATAAPWYCYCACCSSEAATHLCQVCNCSTCLTSAPCRAVTAIRLITTCWLRMRRYASWQPPGVVIVLVVQQKQQHICARSA